MPIKIEDTEIPDVKIIYAPRYIDDRGFFVETYKEIEYLEIGIPKFVQDNMSLSAKGVIRGLHWQVAPFAQGKLVTCLTGSILDIAVDIRKDSDTYLKYVAVELNSQEQKSLWVPEGFAHGFQSLENETRVHYKVTNYWNKNSERSLNCLDPKLALPWVNTELILSNKDSSAPFIN